MNDVRRARLAPALVTTAALLVAGAVAVPAAGAAGRAQVGGAAAAPRVTAGAATTAATTTAATSTTSGGSSSRPHCTGCVEHQVFGFEDGSDDRWRPYGVTTTALAGTRWTSTASPTVGAPHSGGLMLAVSNLGHGGGLRWPGTTDATLSGFQVRVWVRPRARAGTLRLSVGDHTGRTTATALVTPGLWTAITTPRWMGDRSTVEVSLTQDDPCTDGDIGTVDLDDTAVASSFSPEPAIWRSDDTSLLAPALPQITVTTTPCPATTSTGANTELTFEDGTTQGWEAIGKARLKLNTRKPVAGLASLQASNLGAAGAAVHLSTPVTAWGGSGDWYRLVFMAAGSQKVTTRATCGPTRTGVPEARINVTVAGATQVVGSRTPVGPRGSAVEVYFQLPASATTADVTVAAVVTSTGTKVAPLLIDNVLLTHGTPRTRTAQPSSEPSSQPLDAVVAPLCTLKPSPTTPSRTS